MRIGAFDIQEPLPEFKELHAVALLHPWVNAGSVGTLALATLERHLGAKELGKLARPGTFFDFTRYRPISRFNEGNRVVTVPNCDIYYALTPKGPDFLFVHLMEPHAFAERYIHSVVDLLKTLNVKRYCRVSGMYSAVPHTRPLRVTGGRGLEAVARLVEVSPQGGGSYQGPTSIMNSVTEELGKLGVENVNFMVHLPHYLGLEEDYAGTARLVEVLCALYNLPPGLADKERGARQYREAGTEVEHSPQGKALLQRLEEFYDANQTPALQQEVTPLAPDVERFLRELGQQMGES
ncbi:MAG: hypothetical protein HW388_1022 [Dehalococcoidia bacterium]|nr:hypothetical protein [Dehalococcoidia bacterium]